MNKVEEIFQSIPVFKQKIEPICKKYSVDYMDLTKEMIRFLDLIHISSSRLSPSLVVDLAWHEFILFTRFYDTFCKKHYNRFIHHTPGDKSDSGIYLQTINAYINHYGEPHPLIWGNIAHEEWMNSNCGSCFN